MCVTLIFQFLLGCYFKVNDSNAKWLEITFNSFWDATDGDALGAIVLVHGFQFLLGCYSSPRSSAGCLALPLSIPFGMLLGALVVSQTAYMFFQFLLGCYGVMEEYGEPMAFVTFNSFWDATAAGLQAPQAQS